MLSYEEFKTKYCLQNNAKRKELYYLYMLSLGTNTVPCSNKEQETMSMNQLAVASVKAEKPLEQQQADYLKGRLREARITRRDALREKFFMDTPDGPRTLKDFKERLAKGLYTVEDRGFKDDFDFGPYSGLESFSFLSWRTKPADREGYEKAKETMEKEMTSIEDTIMSFDYAEALKQIQKFEKAS